MNSGSDRTSSFVAGDALPGEVFEAGEGTLLLGAGLLVIAALFVVLIFVGRLQGANRRRLDSVASALEERGGGNG